MLAEERREEGMGRGRECSWFIWLRPSTEAWMAHYLTTVTLVQGHRDTGTQGTSTTLWLGKAFLLPSLPSQGPVPVVVRTLASTCGQADGDSEHLFGQSNAVMAERNMT